MHFFILAEKVSAVVLVPSRDLSQQAFCMIQQLSAYCGEDVSSLDVSLEELNILKWDTEILINHFFIAFISSNISIT